MELMLDFETLGNKSDTIVISLGAQLFDLETGKLGQSFYRAIDIDSQIKDGRTIAKDTLIWWMGQSDAAKKVFSEDAFPIRTVLMHFSEFLNKNDFGTDINVWGNGSCFDVSIAENLFRQYDIPTPWKFWNVNDLRTFKRFVANDAKIPRDQGVHHNALTDCINQAKYVIKYGKK